MKGLGFLCAGVVAFGAICFGLSELSYRLDARYSPLQEQVRARTYELSDTHRLAVVHDLEDLKLEYDRSDADHKSTIADIARTRFDEVSPDMMNPTLSQFAQEIGR